MSYEPIVWKDGDLVTSAKLNKIEQGIAGNIMIVEATFVEDPNDYYHKYFETDKTATEIKTAFLNGTTIILHIIENERTLTYGVGEAYYLMAGYMKPIPAQNTEERFYFPSMDNGGSVYFSTISENDKLQFSVYID